MLTNKRVINPQVLLEFICYVTFAGLMFYLVYTDRYQAYVTPRMVPYIYFTIAVMVIWALAGCFRLFQPQYKTRAAHCFVLAIPIILLLLPHTAINTAELSTGYVSANALTGRPGQTASGKTQSDVSGSPDMNISYSSPAAITAGDNSDVAEINLTTPDQSANDTESIPPADTSQSDYAANDASETTPVTDQTSVQEEDSSISLSGLDAVNKKITVSNDDFGAWLYELYVNMDKYVGYQISMTGFVFKDASVMKDNEFVPARLIMSCCVADLSPCGLLCQYDKAAELQADTWVTIVGTLHKSEVTFDDQTYDDIQITVTKITPAESVDGYIYPQ